MKNSPLPQHAEAAVHRRHVQSILTLTVFALLLTAIILSLCVDFSTKNQFTMAVVLILLVLIFAKFFAHKVSWLFADRDFTGTVAKKEIETSADTSPIVLPQDYPTRGPFRARRIFRNRPYMFIRSGDRFLAVRFASVKQMDIYKIGDEVRFVRGLRYPIFTGGRHERIVCPHCGQIYSADRDTCHECGIENIKL